MKKKPSPRKNKINFTSLGCPRNLVDTEVMLGLVLQAGYEITDDIGSADYLVVNTCGFLEAAREESLDTIQWLFEQKKEEAKVVVTGCMVQRHAEAIREAFPDTHYLLGSGDTEKILEAIGADEQGIEISTARSYLEQGEVPRLPSTPPHYAYLKIAEGCRKACSFCIIPKIKGPLQSKSQDRIVKEFHSLLDRGIFEVILIAQDLGDYAKDREGEENLEQLLKALLDTDRQFWLRLLYLYPDEITDGIIELLRRDKRLLPYLDMPLQHISDPVLKAMRRKVSKKDIQETITSLRQAVPDLVLRTSLMVGFPGETEEDFEELLAFIHEYPLDNVGVFQFSPEPGAKASSLPHQVDPKVKEERYHRLMQAQQKIVEKRNERYIGQRLPVMIEGYHPESEFLMVGRHYGQCPEIDSQVILNDTRQVQQFHQLHWVEFTDVAGYDLLGTVIEPIVQEKRNPLQLV